MWLWAHHPWHSLGISWTTLSRHYWPSSGLERPVEQLEAPNERQNSVRMSYYPAGCSIYNESKNFIQYCVFHRKNSGTQEPRNRSRRCSCYYYNKWSTGNFVLCPCNSVLCRVKGPNVERVTILLEDTIKDLQSMTAVWRFRAGRRVIILAGITELDPQEELDCCYTTGARRSTCRTQPSQRRTLWYSLAQLWV